MSVLVANHKLSAPSPHFLYRLLSLGDSIDLDRTKDMIYPEALLESLHVVPNFIPVQLSST